MSAMFQHGKQSSHSRIVERRITLELPENVNDIQQFTRDKTQKHSREDMTEQLAKDRKIERLEIELKKLDTTWNPPTHKVSTEKATVIETDSDGQETAKEVHFVFNTGLMTDVGEPKTFKQAI